MSHDSLRSVGAASARASATLATARQPDPRDVRRREADAQKARRSAQVAIDEPFVDDELGEDDFDGRPLGGADFGAELDEHAAAAHDDEIGLPPPAPRAPFWLLLMLTLLTVGVIGGLFAAGWLPRVELRAALREESERLQHALPRVVVAFPRQSPVVTTTVLPGDVQALEETTVYPRISGYLKRWLVDIGDEVQAGQLLAEIDTPEVDQELRQASATLGQLRAKLLTASANLKLAEATLRRYSSLRESKAISHQEYDEHAADAETARSNVDAAKADVTAGEANVQRLTELQSFARVLAPFEGTITARNIESGHLVSSGNGVAQSLFRLAKTDPARVFVHVPQMYAVGVRPELPAELIVREMPSRKFVGKVTRTARSIDPATRTLLTEIRVPNADHALLTGSYVQVRMSIARDTPPLLLPASALVINAEGTSVAIVDAQDVVHFRQVEVEGDFGADVGIIFGLTVGDRVVTNPSERLTEGSRVAVDADPTSKPRG